jgi:hypothetical protein
MEIFKKEFMNTNGYCQSAINLIDLIRELAQRKMPNKVTEIRKSKYIFEENDVFEKCNGIFDSEYYLRLSTIENKDYTIDVYLQVNATEDIDPSTNKKVYSCWRIQYDYNFIRFVIDKKIWKDKKYLLKWQKKYHPCDDFEILHSFLVRNNLYEEMTRRLEGDILVEV